MRSQPKTDPPPSSSAGSPPSFVTTQWTRVLEARGDSSDAKTALSDLCAAYYAPVYSFIRFRGHDDDAARDLAQEFFARLLSGSGLGFPDPRRGRFRSFLLGAVKHFLSDMHDRSRRLKRGAGQIPEPLDLASDTDISQSRQFADTRLRPEQEFDRKWALTVLDRALASLAAEHGSAGKHAHFAALKPWLTGDTETSSQAEAARLLGLNEGAVKVAIHRLRRRFRELVKTEIAQTLRDPAQVENELACLLRALSG